MAIDDFNHISDGSSQIEFERDCRLLASKEMKESGVTAKPSNPGKPTLGRD
jgi:hypothetical protein